MKKKIFKVIFIVIYVCCCINYLAESDDPVISTLAVFITTFLIYYFYKKKKSKNASPEKHPIRPSSTKIKPTVSIPTSNIKEVEVITSCTKHKRISSSRMPDIHFTNVTKQTNLDKLSNFVSLDLETTGLSAYRDRIVEVSAVRFVNWEPVECFHTLVNPKVSISSEVTSINGITNEMVADAPEFCEIIDALDSFIGKSNIVGHNLKFDLRFLFCSGYDFSVVKSRKYYDTLSLVRNVLSKDGRHWNVEDSCYDYNDDDIDVENYKLTTLCDYYGIRDNSDAHRALSDSLATGILLKNLVDDKLSK